jgi:hypothetical protein
MAQAFPQARKCCGDLEGNLIASTNEVLREVGEPRVTSTLQWRSDARDEALMKMRSALEKAGITFLPETAQGAGLWGRRKGSG